MSEIHINGLRLMSKVGVPDLERAVAQELKCYVKMRPWVSFDGIEDDVSQTIDYAEVVTLLESIAASEERKLIETLCTAMVHGIFTTYRLDWVWVRIEKFILPQTDSVAVESERGRRG